MKRKVPPAPKIHLIPEDMKPEFFISKRLKRLFKQLNLKYK